MTHSNIDTLHKFSRNINTAHAQIDQTFRYTVLYYFQGSEIDKSGQSRSYGTNQKNNSFAFLPFVFQRVGYIYNVYRKIQLLSNHLQQTILNAIPVHLGDSCEV